MNPLPAFTLSLFALTASAATPSAPISRSGLPPTAVSGQAAAPFLSWPDQVFADGLEGMPAGGDPVTVYTDRTAFLAAVADGYSARDFSEIQHGLGHMLIYNDGMDYDLDNPYADPPPTEPAPYWYVIYSGLFPSNPLYNGSGFISSDRVDDPISVFTQLGLPPITAIGGDVWTSDFSLQPVTGSLTITIVMQDGMVDPMNVTVDATTPATFMGFIAPIGQPIAGILVHANQVDSPVPDESPDRWPTLDNLVVGSARP